MLTGSAKMVNRKSTAIPFYINKYLLERQPFTIISICLLVILVLAVIDNATGYELSFSIFYLLPVSTAPGTPEKSMV